MKIDSFIKDHPTLNYAPALKTICAPLAKLGIVYFSHVHIDNQFKMSCLALCPDFFKLYFDKGYYNYDLHMAKNNDQQYIIWDAVERKKQSKNLHQDFMSFNQGHTFSLIFNNGDTTDYYHFAAKLNNHLINEQYLQNFDALNLFIMHFKDKVRQHKELAYAYNLKFALYKHNGDYIIEPSSQLQLEKFYDLIDVERVYVNGSNVYITKREIECMHWISQGKTADEIAKILLITPRTVKAHVENIKNKTGCYNQFQLGMVYAKLLHEKAAL